MVEVLSSCPTNWGIPVVQSLQWIESNMLPYYPMGDYKVLAEVEALK
jgi:2-oxoglutarate ferredoxin oxidoreductase subunit beta